MWTLYLVLPLQISPVIITRCTFKKKKKKTNKKTHPQVVYFLTTLPSPSSRSPQQSGICFSIAKKWHFLRDDLPSKWKWEHGPSHLMDRTDADFVVEYFIPLDGWMFSCHCCLKWHTVFYTYHVCVCVCFSSSAKPPQYTCWDDCQSVSYQKTRCYRIRRTGKLNEIIVFRTLQMNRLRDTSYVMYNAMYICIFSYKKNIWEHRVHRKLVSQFGRTNSEHFSRVFGW